MKNENLIVFLIDFSLFINKFLYYNFEIFIFLTFILYIK